MGKQKRKSPGKITSKDVAELAGVSQSTVSRVLGSNEDAKGFISDETTKRVKQAAKELGYSPNPIARALRGQPTNLIGLVVREIADPFFAELIEVLSIQIRNLGLNAVLGHAHSDPSQALKMAHVLDSRQCDGVIFIGDFRDDEKAIKSIMMENRPVVALCRGRSLYTLPTINVNNSIGIKMLIDHLISLGHTSFVFIDGGWFGDIHERRSFFLSEMAKYEGEFEYSWLQASDNSAKGGYQAMHEVSKMSQKPTAVMASDDGMAIGLLKAASDLGIYVPEDISVTGFDDIGSAAFTIPGLTTVKQPLEEMSKLALDHLLKLINMEAVPVHLEFTQITPKLIIRGSTGPRKEN